ncbi:WD40/YVTN/BNR-like repeat-containing protein [Streptomyces sp. NPDC090112]|uniref:WD40/YVTN/BNR-like repeat-containing protein n=1 Tax=Streptomyces sp. NPDC090112 TaxID=3365949 RepID=UPI0037F5F99F
MTAITSGTLIVVGDGGLLRVSEDAGETWKKQDVPDAPDLTSIAWGGKTGAQRFVVAGFAQGRTVTYILDAPGQPPTTASIQATSRPRQVAFSAEQGRFVMVGDAGLIAHSADGTSWEVATSGVNTDLLDVTFGKDTWVAVGRNGMILTSPDAVTWTYRNSSTSANVTGIVWNAADARYTAVTNTQNILQSSDAKSWEHHFSEDLPPGASGIASLPASNTYLAVGNRVGIATATAPQTAWQRRTLENASRRFDLTCAYWSQAHKRFYATGENTTVLRSQDDSGSLWDYFRTGGIWETATVRAISEVPNSAA